MEKKEYKAGETFQCGLVKLKAMEISGLDCSKCFFYSICTALGNDSLLLTDFIGGCCIADRNDKGNIIFVKVEE